MTDEVVARFKKGELIIFPTDTVYGVGCIISNEKAIKRLHELKNDPPDKPTLILAADKTQAFKYGVFNKAARKLTQNFWPGPLTIVVEAKENVPKIIRGGDGTIAIRVPNQPPILNIIKQIGEPILAPSANFHYELPPASFTEIDKRLISLVDYAVDLSQLKNAAAMTDTPSTLVSVIKEVIKIIRPGAIAPENLEKALEEPRR
jgi:L-threonylcarbamoyladenylate synthase